MEATRGKVHQPTRPVRSRKELNEFSFLLSRVRSNNFEKVNLCRSLNQTCCQWVLLLLLFRGNHSIHNILIYVR